MNQPQPNPLHTELARGERAEAHPDEDVLTAFAEHGLPERERGQVMEHLSHCSECREVLSFAVAAVPEVRQAVYTLPVRPPLRGWLPWMAIAAGVAVVSSAVVLHERAARVRVEQKSAMENEAKATPPQPLLPQAEVPQPAGPAPPEPAAKQDQQRQSAAPQSPTDAVKKIAPAEPKPAAALEQEANSNLPLALTGRDVGQVATAAAAGATTSTMAAANAPPAPPIAAQDEAVHGIVSARAKVAPVPGAAAAPTFGGLMGGTGSLARSTARPQWRINAQGQAERSPGYGPWQTVLADEKARMRVVSVYGDEVWLGGESLRLYHSDDNGTTWHMVQLPAKGRGEPVITHIRVQDVQLVTAEAEDGTQWSTVDGGATWK